MNRNLLKKVHDIWYKAGIDLISDETEEIITNLRPLVGLLVRTRRKKGSKISGETCIVK